MEVQILGLILLLTLTREGSLYKSDGGDRRTFWGLKFVFLVLNLKLLHSELWRYLLGYWAEKYDRK